MVNFNENQTVGTPAVDIERITILERRYNLIEAFEDYKKRKFKGSTIPVSNVWACLLSMFVEIQAMLKRRLKKEDYEKIKNVVMNPDSDETELYFVIEQINEELDKIRLTRVDTQKVYDSTDVEAENKIKGY